MQDQIKLPNEVKADRPGDDDAREDGARELVSDVAYKQLVSRM